MKTVTIGFSRARSKWKVGSLVLQKSEKRNYSHCYVQITSPYSPKPLIAQASHGMVNLMTMAAFERENVRVKEYVLRLATQDSQEFECFIFDSLGIPYSITQLLLLAVKKLFHFEIKKYNEDKYYICSEYAAKIAHFCGVNINSSLDYVTPSDLDLILSQVEGAQLYELA